MAIAQLSFVAQGCASCFPRWLIARYDMSNFLDHTRPTRQTTMNPYQMPESSLEKASSLGNEVAWWSWRGRIGRAHYAILNISMLLIFLLGLFVVLQILEASLFRILPVPMKLLASLLLFGGLILSVQAWLAARRWNDLGCSSRFGLFSLIPVINLILFLILLCLQGDASENAYGASPAPAPWWQLLLALLFGLPLLMGMMLLIILPMK